GADLDVAAGPDAGTKGLACGGLFVQSPPDRPGIYHVSEYQSRPRVLVSRARRDYLRSGLACGYGDLRGEDRPIHVSGGGKFRRGTVAALGIGFFGLGTHG